MLGPRISSHCLTMLAIIHSFWQGITSTTLLALLQSVYIDHRLYQGRRNLASGTCVCGAFL
jgi:hypothetical protein